jgi:Fe-S cluster biogenesis protein NfuA
VSESVRITVFEPPPRAELCRFRVSRPVLPGAQDYFGSLEEAGGHALFRALLEIPAVDGVGAEHDQVVLVRRDRAAAWRPIMEAATEAIESWFAAGLAPELPTIAEGDAAGEALLREKVERVIAEVVNPGVAAHSGEVRLVEVRGSRVFVTLGGGCQGCSASAITVRHGLTSAIRKAAPEVTEIVDVTDHAAGQRPWYSSDEGTGESALPTG